MHKTHSEKGSRLLKQPVDMRGLTWPVLILGQIQPERCLAQNPTISQSCQIFLYQTDLRKVVHYRTKPCIKNKHELVKMLQFLTYELNKINSN